MATEVIISGEQLNIIWVQDFIVNQSFYEDYSFVYVSGNDTIFRFKNDIDAAKVAEVQFFASLNSPTYVRPIQEDEEEGKQTIKSRGSTQKAKNRSTQQVQEEGKT